MTDRCNLRCQYCMPERHYVWLPRADVLTFEEIASLVDAFMSIGVDRVRLTGGEPLIRRDLPALVSMLAGKSGLADIALTTNGVLLADQASDLLAAGLHRITVSLDTLRPDRFESVTRFDEHSRVLAGIAAASRAGFSSVKLDSVVIRGVNDDEILDLLDFGRDAGAEVRFIEYMDVGGATQWSPEKVVSRREILDRIAERHGGVRPVVEESSAPAERFLLADGTVFGIIASTTAPFCSTCDRSRLTADGLWYRCLYASQGLDLRGPLRSGATPGELSELLASTWTARTDRGAEERLALVGRSPLVDALRLRRDPHLEMHTRGG